jgi:membrane protein
MSDRVERLMAVARAWLDRWRWTRITRAAVVGFVSHEGLQYAGSMAYFSVLSIVNLLVLGVVVTSTAVGEEAARQFIIDRVTSGSPIDATLIGDLIDNALASRGGVTVLGVVLVTWGALGAFGALSGGIGKVFQDAAPRRPFWQDRLIGLMLLVAAGALGLGSVVFGIVTDVVARLAKPVAGAGPGDLLLSAVGLVLPMLTVFAAFFVVYRIVPNRRLTAAEIWPGALVATALWTALRIGFTFYATRIARYDSVFGPIAAGISLLVFLYFSSVIVLVGAEVTRASALEDEQRTTAIE